MEKNDMVTIYDVAKRANVSIATVSYALNNKNSVSQKTRERIKKLAEEMGYIPNSLAQGLLKKETKIIGVVIPDLSQLYNATMLKHIQEEARSNGYFILLGTNYGDFATSLEIVNEFIAKNVDALIVRPAIYRGGGAEAYHALIHDTRKKGIPLISINETFKRPDENFVVPDWRSGQHALTSYLLQQGKRDLLYMGGLDSHINTHLRAQGFMDALRDAGLDGSSANRFEGGGYDFIDGYRAVKELAACRSMPEAIATVTDSYALGVYKGLIELGYQVPNDVSLVGYNDLIEPTLNDLSLTTMRTPLKEIADLCMKAIKLCKTDKEGVVQHIVPPQLIQRASV
jgi:DNA-binding LacI/PurR family transcriptional regulator